MLRVTDNDTEKKLRGLRKENPNYDAMWNRIRLETDKRNSGWQEHTAVPQPRRGRRKWAIPVACASLAAVVALGAAASQGYFESLSPQAQAASVGQAMQAQAEAEGIVLKLNNVVQGKDRGYGQNEALSKMVLDFSLSGFGSEDVQVAGFDKSSITDLDTGKKLELSMGDFNTNDIRSVDAWEADRTLNTSARATGELGEAEGPHRYRLETSDLYMIRRTTVPIEGGIKLGAEYTVLPDRDFKMKITDIKWNKKSGMLKIKFLPDENVPKIEAQDSTLLAMDRGNSVGLKLGDRELGWDSWSEGGNSREAEGSYNVKGLTEDQLSDMTMTFTYAEPLRVVKGPWTIDFTIDPAKAEIPTETIPVEDDSALTEQTGWKLGDAQLDAYGVTIPLDRGAEDRPLHDGQIVNYGSISLTDGEVTTLGGQDPTPEMKMNGYRSEEQEFVKFGVQGMVRNGNENKTTNDYWESYDFRGKPLTATFSGAWIAHIDPDRWVSLGVPTEEEQKVTDTLADGKKVVYTVHRKGKDVLVEIEVPDYASLYEGTRLRVDGKDYAYDKEPTEDSSIQNARGYYNQVDIYRNVPEGEKFEINLLAYGTVDNTKDAKVIIRK
ncbi:hypothetical protein [Saccharibacillus alkalitolerans]|uniref:DUF4179 domain-containing protein n=1 Tax=Saccharibacillus alkalitolerans TaxID=2705290 RepID=A0ABX0F384_9BACL|nr:hypothetical protein [Saccharibacillus alkalitolerans]NGZ74890.1 hypothetical protein [Saccharibacillus alkalitolerans]